MCFFLSASTMAGPVYYTVSSAPPTPAYGNGQSTTPYDGPPIQSTQPAGAPSSTVTPLYPKN